jgi:hypothetical protein
MYAGNGFSIDKWATILATKTAVKSRVKAVLYRRRYRNWTWKNPQVKNHAGHNGR